GIGLADVVTDRLVNSVDWRITHINSITSNSITAIRTPIHFPTDKVCLEKLALAAGVFDHSAVTLVRIRNTMHLELMEMTETLRAEVEANPQLEILETRDWSFDAEGNLPDTFGVFGEAAH